MSIEALHPAYQKMIEDWIIMCDTYAGQRMIKEKGRAYLPATTGMVLDGITSVKDPGYVAYSAYLSRARFPEVVKPSIEGMIGLMHRKPPEIQLPTVLEPLRKKITARGESIEVLLRKINEQQLHQGRVGLLVDVPNGNANVMPFISIYTALSIRNWDDSPKEQTDLRSLQYVILDQSGSQRSASDRFEWVNKKEYLLLLFDAGVVTYTIYDENLVATKTVTPMLGGQTFDQIPFIFINTLDLTPEPDYPPLLPLANEALSLYRLDADYRQALFLQGQDTLVITGAEKQDNYRLGANSVLVLEDKDADAKYIGVGSLGLSEVRTAHEKSIENLSEMGSSTLRTKGSDSESGDALRIRISARTASIVGIARAGAKGLEDALKYCAMIKGADPDQVSVAPNLDFSEDQFNAKELLDYANAKRMGAPISWETIHMMLKNREVTQMTFDEEIERIGQEDLLSVGNVITDPGSQT